MDRFTRLYWGWLIYGLEIICIFSVVAPRWVLYVQLYILFSNQDGYCMCNYIFSNRGILCAITYFIFHFQNILITSVSLLERLHSLMQMCLCLTILPVPINVKYRECPTLLVKQWDNYRSQNFNTILLSFLDKVELSINCNLFTLANIIFKTLRLWKGWIAKNPICSAFSANCSISCQLILSVVSHKTYICLSKL